MGKIKVTPNLFGTEKEDSSLFRAGNPPIFHMNKLQEDVLLATCKVDTSTILKPVLDISESFPLFHPGEINFGKTNTLNSASPNDLNLRPRIDLGNSSPLLPEDLINRGTTLGVKTYIDFIYPMETAYAEPGMAFTRIFIVSLDEKITRYILTMVIIRYE